MNDSLSPPPGSDPPAKTDAAVGFTFFAEPARGKMQVASLLPLTPEIGDADAPVRLVESLDLRAMASDAARPAQPIPARQLIALELTDGVLLTTAQRLHATATQCRGYPLLIGGKIDLHELRAENRAKAGSTKVVLIRRLHKLESEQPSLPSALEKPDDFVSALRKIEAADGHGRLLRWPGPSKALIEPPEGWARQRTAEPRRLLVFIHDLGLDTLTCFNELVSREPEVWSALERAYPGPPAEGGTSEADIYGFEHPTFSATPIENALALLKALPQGATADFVTLGRGGLIGDLLVARFDDKLIAGYERDVTGFGPWGSAEQPCQGAAANRLEEPMRSGVVASESGTLPTPGPAPAGASTLRTHLNERLDAQRELLRELATLNEPQRLKVGRYVRVACPARGSKLAGGDIDFYLSMLLAQVATILVRVPFEVARRLQRMVLTLIAGCHDAHVIPGLEPLLPDSPLPRLLRSAVELQPGLEMAVIAGDHRDTTVLHRLATLVTDHFKPGDFEHDLLVDTPSMLGGVAGRAGAKVLFGRGSRAAHLRHFSDLDARLGVRDWLTVPARELATKDGRSTIQGFTQLPHEVDHEDTRGAEEDALGRARSQLAAATAPIVLIVPSLMGSHLAVRRPAGSAGRSLSAADPVRKDGAVGGYDRIWFDPFDIADGAIEQLKVDQPAEGIDGAARTGQAPPRPQVEAEKLFGRYYGKLLVHLAASHVVERFAYDWRLSMEKLGKLLAARLQKMLDAKPSQTVRILSHGTGALVVRAAAQLRPDLFERLRDRKDARLVMLGPPHHGSHAMVETLLGKSDSIRSIARLDTMHGMQQVLDIVASFPGPLSVLPPPPQLPEPFKDAFFEAQNLETPRDYFDPKTWTDLRTKARDDWFGKEVAARFDENSQALMNARWLWDKVERGLPPEFADRNFAINVLGMAANTACGLKEWHDERDDGDTGVLRLIGTALGDGIVTWASSAIANVARTYYMPVEHGALCATAEHFEALTDLLKSGDTSRLRTLPPLADRDRENGPIHYDAGPPLMDDSDTLARGLMGAMAPSGLIEQSRRRLEVSVRATDLRFVQAPILVGHYLNDPISGPERLIDEELLARDLSVRYGLGAYAGTCNSATIVLRRPNELELQRGRLTGAVVAGLGGYDQPLNRGALVDAIRTAVLRYLLHSIDVLGRDDSKLKLCALLVGYDSSVNLGIDDTVSALVRGTLQANAKFQEMTHKRAHVDRLELVELYMDTAIAAVYALRALAPRLSVEARREQSLLFCRQALLEGEGVRPRLTAGARLSQWSRLIITNKPTAREARAGTAAAPPPSATAPPATPQVSALGAIDAMNFVYIGSRARAEATLKQLQPNLLDKLMRRQLTKRAWDGPFARMMFQLLIPPEFKDIVRQVENLILIVDETTASLPWEMICDSEADDDDQEPLAIRTPIVRQLQTYHSRPRSRVNYGRSALVVGGPMTNGTEAEFEGWQNPLGTLQAAQSEGRCVDQQLRQANWKPDLFGSDADANSILKMLLGGSYRIIHIAAHGIYNLKHNDGDLRSGVVLSDGVLMTAEELSSMGTLPELVFLNCCSLGRTDPAPTLEPAAGPGGAAQPGPEPFRSNAFAASLATQLIRNGVRCVVVTGWPVDDGLAETFARTFYEALLQHNRTFGDAVQMARKACRDDTNGGAESSTWAAYQAYGDVGWRVESAAGGTGALGPEGHASAEELLDELVGLRVGAAQRRLQVVAERSSRVQKLRSLLAQVPSAWLDLPVVQSAVGAAWSDLREFEEAKKALDKAIKAVDQRGRVPIRDIERIARAEIHVATRGNDVQGIGTTLEERADALDRLVKAGEESPARKLYREALRAGADRRIAAVFAAEIVRGGPAIGRTPSQDPFREMCHAARNAADRYWSMYNSLAQHDFNPYHALTHLMMKSVSEPLPIPPSITQPQEALLTRCANAVRDGFGGEGTIYETVAGPSIELMRALLNGSLGAAYDRGRQAHDRVVATYEQATDNVNATPAALGNIFENFHLLALLHRAHSIEAGRSKQFDMRDYHRNVHEALKTIAERLAPGCGDEWLPE
ncbi:MAG: CHAT domain-containing protein [Burkholderiaceae bacterium]